MEGCVGVGMRRRRVALAGGLGAPPSRRVRLSRRVMGCVGRLFVLGECDEARGRSCRGVLGLVTRPIHCCDPPRRLSASEGGEPGRAARPPSLACRREGGRERRCPQRSQPAGVSRSAGLVRSRPLEPARSRRHGDRGGLGKVRARESSVPGLTVSVTLRADHETAVQGSAGAWLLGREHMARTVSVAAVALNRILRVALVVALVVGQVRAACHGYDTLEELIKDSLEVADSGSASVSGLSQTSTRLVCPQAQLTGTIPTELGLFTNLEYIQIGANSLQGGLPTEIGALNKLIRLAAFDNDLSGPLPTELGALTALTSLSLSDNGFEGNVPAEVANLASLNELLLNGNSLGGPIPEVLTSLTSLSSLSLAENEFTGTIPDMLATLPVLTRLLLDNNNLTGSVPVSLSSMDDLITLSLFSNRLAGTIPSELGNLVKLEFLLLDDNELTGSSSRTGESSTTDSSLGKSAFVAIAGGIAAVVLGAALVVNRRRARDDLARLNLGDDDDGKLSSGAERDSGVDRVIATLSSFNSFRVEFASFGSAKNSKSRSPFKEAEV
ncbi:MDIS1-interacting receptor like kinase 2 (AtMIK2) (Probable LRR receptor-like serine/threonine-protein kinase At4g08850) [Durusdinium trenchii]|uniref:MDIS1-interacting receptor like kinase 2 (AtMIK2) (Probable LRR receptor-like serine/threonine-protein kinase At4g08850) n=1 Tax=Durusdinium trenchii TaxID=1381693 RepID=A0ABP0I1N5_9DINO